MNSDLCSRCGEQLPKTPLRVCYDCEDRYDRARRALLTVLRKT